MDKESIIAFFNRLAPEWDAKVKPDGLIIEKILDSCDIKAGSRILDVACGTGVLFPYYIQRGVSQIVGIDISPEMVKIARAKYSQEARISIVCSDIAELEDTEPFDAVLVYNALPHFPDPHALIELLSRFLKPGGKLAIAHGASRDAINSHHSGTASAVSKDLISSEELAAILSDFFIVTDMVSDESMYLACGELKPL